MFETQTILEKMTEKDISSDEFRPADGVITYLTQLTKEHFHDLLSSDPIVYKNYRDDSISVFSYASNSSFYDFYSHEF